uniref:Uncharacterized protein n=1 Tax=Romanomermis culicivorax TaxID=13658 RepID=A0A915KJB6_ROMCU
MIKDRGHRPQKDHQLIIFKKLNFSPRCLIITRLGCPSSNPGERDLIHGIMLFAPMIEPARPKFGDEQRFSGLKCR